MNHHKKSIKQASDAAYETVDRFAKARQVLRRARKAISDAFNDAITAVRVAARKIVDLATKPL